MHAAVCDVWTEHLPSPAQFDVWFVAGREAKAHLYLTARKLLPKPMLVRARRPESIGASQLPPVQDADEFAACMNARHLSDESDVSSNTHISPGIRPATRPTTATPR